MKKISVVKIIIALFIGLFLLQAPKKASAQVSFQIFYDELSPYGQWVSDPYYGYVWVPSMGADFRPYFTGGHWVYSQYGNMWVSDYPWGWAPFHYGRWVYDDFYGWMWIPGNTWGPAWVCWRHGGGYYGWAPLGPGVYVNISLYTAPDPWWVFVPQTYILYPDFHRYYYGPRENNVYINNTTIINNTYVNKNVVYYTGPGRNEIQQVTKQPVNVYNVNRSGARGVNQISGNSVNVYGPHVNSTNNTPTGGRVEPAPSKVVSSTHPINNNNFIANNKNVKLPPPHSVNGNAPQSGAKNETPQQQNKPQINNAPHQQPQVAPKQMPQQNNPPPHQQPQVTPKQMPQQNNPAPHQQPQMQPKQQAPQQQPQMAPQQMPHNNNAPHQQPQMQPRQQAPQQQPQMAPQQMPHNNPAPHQQPQMQPKQQAPQQQPQMAPQQLPHNNPAPHMQQGGKKPR